MVWIAEYMSSEILVGWGLSESAIFFGEWVVDLSFFFALVKHMLSSILPF